MCSAGLLLPIALFPAMTGLAGCAPEPCDTGEVAGGNGCLPAGAGGACGVDEALFEAVSLEETAVPTVFNVRWSTVEPAAGAVWYRVEGEGWRRTAVREAAASHEQLLAGLPAGHEVQWQVVREPEGEAPRCSGVQAAETGTPPAELPGADLTVADESALASGYVVVPVLGPTPLYVAILDEQARYVWWWEADESTTRASFSRDGSAVLFNVEAPSEEEPGQVVRVSLDGQEEVLAEVAGIHTDFVELPDGGVAALGWEIRQYEGEEGESRKLLGNTIEEVTAEGEHRTLWNIFHDFTPDLSKDYGGEGFYEADPDVEDWSHVNGLWYDSDSGDYYVTINRFNGVACIDGAKGALRWIMASKYDDFRFQSTDMLFSSPHSVQSIGSRRLLVFNRRIEADACSDVTEYIYSAEKGAVEASWTYSDPGCINVTSLGEARRLEGGNTLVIWSSAGQMDQVTPEGESVWRVQNAIGSAFGFGEHIDALP